MKQSKKEIIKQAQESEDLQLDTAEASKRDIIMGVIIAGGVALALLVTTILPAEYGLDPTGMGKLLGFSQMNKEKKENNAKATKSATIRVETEATRHDTVEITIKPNHGLEYKFEMEEGAALIYSWKASVPIYYDFHGEPSSGPKGSFVSFEEKTATSANGSFTAPFKGTQGWYWTNKTLNPITIKLTTSGFYKVVGIKNESPLTK